MAVAATMAALMAADSCNPRGERLKGWAEQLAAEWVGQPLGHRHGAAERAPRSFHPLGRHAGRDGLSHHAASLTA
jgi:hypothetical protein